MNKSVEFTIQLLEFAESGSGEVFSRLTVTDRVTSQVLMQIAGQFSAARCWEIFTANFSAVARAGNLR